jgi:hypothetical protein
MFDEFEASWLDPSTHAVQRSVISRGDVARFTDNVRSVRSGIFWEAIDVGTVALEVGLVLTAVSRRWFRAGLSVAVLLHAAIWLVLGISFTGQVIAYGAFVPWGAAVRRVRGRALTPPSLPALPRPIRVAGPLALVVAGGLALNTVTEAVDPDRTLIPAWFGPQAVNDTVFAIAVAVSAVYLATTSVGTVRAIRSAHT